MNASSCVGWTGRVRAAHMASRLRPTYTLTDNGEGESVDPGYQPFDGGDFSLSEASVVRGNDPTETESAIGIFRPNCLNLTPIIDKHFIDRAVPDGSLRSLLIANMPSGKAGWICEAQEITELHAENMGIKKIDGIENLTGLQKLWLDGNPEIEGIRWLSNPSPLPLIELHLNGCTKIIWNGIPIRRLHCLEVLDMTGCVGKTGNLFESLNETLYDPYCDVYLDKLEKLYLSGCENLSTCGINVLAYLQGLEYVDLSNCSGIDSLDCLIENPNFGNDGGSEDTIDITGLSFSGLDDDVDCLCAKGVKVKNGSIENVCTGGETCETHVTSCRSACPNHRFHTTCTGGEMDDCSALEGELCDIGTGCE